MLLGAVALTACSKDTELAPEVAVQSSETPKTMLVDANLSVGQDLGELRMLYKLKDDGSGKTDGLAMVDKDVRIRLAIKRGTGAPVYSEYTFTKVPGENRAIYSGQITVPAEGTGDYKLSAILMGETDGGNTYGTINATDPRFPERIEVTKTPEALVLPTNNQLDAYIPYVSAWQTLTLNAAGTAIAPTKIKFEPQGTLLRFRIKNETGEDFNIKQVDFLTSAFSPSGCYHLDRESTTKVGFPHFERTGYYSPYSYTLPVTNQLISARTNSTTPSFSPWYYIWVMPTESNVMETRVDLVTTDGKRIVGVFSTNHPIPPVSIPVTLTIKDSGHEAYFGDIGESEYEWGSTPGRPKLALEYVAEYDFDATGTALVRNDNPDDTSVGRFSWDEAVAKFSTPVTIDGVKYSIPTAAEMRSIFPAQYYMNTEDGIRVEFSASGFEKTNFRERDVKLGSVTKDYYSDFKTVSGICYAVRFKDNTNANRTAFRYRRITSGGRLVRWEVTCRYLGNNANVGITQVANPTFWTSNNSNDVVRNFANRGYVDRLSGEMKLTFTRYWLSDEYDPYVGYSLRFHSSYVINKLDHKEGGFQVRPFIRD